MLLYRKKPCDGAAALNQCCGPYILRIVGFLGNWTPTNQKVMACPSNMQSLCDGKTYLMCALNIYQSSSITGFNICPSLLLLSASCLIGVSGFCANIYLYTELQYLLFSAVKKQPQSKMLSLPYFTITMLFPWMIHCVLFVQNIYFRIKAKMFNLVLWDNLYRIGQFVILLG